jgi:hypothetical protein
MARQLSPSAIGAFLSGILVVIVLILQGYLYAVKAKPEPAVNKGNFYDTSVISTELDPKNTKSVFALTASLNTSSTNASGRVEYSPSELGKSDISRNDL